ncbi:hypothetical protein MAP00_001569 [Monascus purpureus]|nr:hypothetical protein MAP00_001569 [Monascus purpureus]
MRGILFFTDLLSAFGSCVSFATILKPTEMGVLAGSLGIFLRGMAYQAWLIEGRFMDKASGVWFTRVVIWFSADMRHVPAFYLTNLFLCCFRGPFLCTSLMIFDMYSSFS